MLACIACSAKEGGEDGSRAAATPAVKSLTSQVRACPTRLSHPLLQLLYVHATPRDGSTLAAYCPFLTLACTTSSSLFLCICNVRVSAW
jgi:hypothetical protein